eukprot:GHVL01013997.1.p1 GENE.GHVL01013997.1~~GHVL01013997.1.p1  ORF type:complete len:359 (-),score=63.66 GHVL01013997.1:50-1126(-)
MFLAQALLMAPKFLILDEPTNHLDLETVLWLTDYLSRWKHTLIIVSHDRDFLDQVIESCIYLDVSTKKLSTYTGGIDSMLKRRQQERRELEKTAAKKMKEVQGKKDKKKLRPPPEYDVNWSFPGGETLTDTDTIRFVNVSASYITGKNVFSGIDVGISMKDKIVLVGPNGGGKTTFIRILLNKLEPCDGRIEKDPRWRFGYLGQEFDENLNMDLTPVEMLCQEMKTTEFVARQTLAKYQLKSEHHTTQLKHCSGGQKVRVSLALLGTMKPDFIVMDEPTNHLDLESVEALADALSEFPGGLLVVTHDAYMIDKIECKVLVCDEGSVDYYQGTLEDYRDELLETIENWTLQSAENAKLN